jgi:hypothetical protein
MVILRRWTCDRGGLGQNGPLTDPKLTTMLNESGWQARRWPAIGQSGRPGSPELRDYLVILVAAVGMACGQGDTPTGPTPGIPPMPGDLTSSLSTAFDALAIPASGGACSISISQHGQVLLERGRGQIAAGREASADSLYRIASLTKPITASAVLINEQAGRLSRTDKISRFLAFPGPAPTNDELIKHIPGSRLRRIRTDGRLRRRWTRCCRSSSHGTAFGATSTATRTPSFLVQPFNR